MILRLSRMPYTINCVWPSSPVPQPPIPPPAPRTIHPKRPSLRGLSPTDYFPKKKKSTAARSPFPHSPSASAHAPAIPTWHECALPPRYSSCDLPACHPRRPPAANHNTRQTTAASLRNSASSPAPAPSPDRAATILSRPPAPHLPPRSPHPRKNSPEISSTLPPFSTRPLAALPCANTFPHANSD